MSLKYGRSLEEQLKSARGDLRITKRNAAAADSTHTRELLRRESLYELAMASRDQQLEWLEDQMPRFYEKPVFVILVTMYVVLRMVSLSV